MTQLNLLTKSACIIAFLSDGVGAKLRSWGLEVFYPDEFWGVAAAVPIDHHRPAVGVKRVEKRYAHKPRPVRTFAFPDSSLRFSCLDI